MASFESLETLKVSCSTHQYNIHIGQKILWEKYLLPLIDKRKVFLVSDTIIAPLWLGSIKLSLSNCTLSVYLLEPGEINKSLDSVQVLLKAMIASQLNRDSIVISLGGGVVGDIVGFTASCYQRGIDYIQIPTTLLAQVDASVGGKTGVNFQTEKNVVGAFHAPRAVFITPEFLTTLPKREFIAGLAEIIKYALIADREFFIWLQDSVDKLIGLEPASLRYAIKKCCQIKADIVSMDEKEHGQRALLNLGHTFAHALESITKHKRWLHGEAVSIGLYCQALLSMQLGYITQTDLRLISELLEQCGLPLFISKNILPENLIKLMLRDKKVLKSEIRFVVLKNIGAAQVEAVNDMPLIKFVLEKAMEGNDENRG